MSKYYGVISRSLIALLFVVAGVQKLMGFAGTAQFIGSLGVPLPVIATIIVIIIEIPVALLFAYGYKVREMGWTLIGFTLLATILAHSDFSQGMNMLMALKNIAVVGGIMACISCACGCTNCEVKKA